MPVEDYDLNDDLVRERMNKIARSAAIGAGFMLFFAVYLRDLRGVSPSPLYNISVAAFCWTLRAGGALMAVTAVALWLGWRRSLLIDALVTVLIGALLIGIGLIWLANRDLQGALQLFFGTLFLRAGRTSWEAWSGLSVLSTVRPSAATEQEEEEEEAWVAPAGEPVARESAIDRLLAARRREKTHEAAVQRSVKRRPADPGQRGAPYELEARPAPPALPAAAPSPVSVPKPKSAVLPEPPPSPASPAAPSADEPPPEGFLAQLGQDD